jgi:hypothetical protein
MGRRPLLEFQQRMDFRATMLVINSHVPIVKA